MSFASRFHTKTLYAPFLSSIITTCPPATSCLITRIMLVVKQTSHSSSFRNLLHYPVTSILLPSNIFLSTLFPNTLSPCSFLIVTDQVPHHYIKEEENYILLGAFPKSRKATISFVMSVRPSVLLEHLGSHWTDFHDILRIYRQFVEKLKFAMKSDENRACFT